MKEEILTKLAEISETENITVLFASEVGSRTWGYNNESSDYDIKFIYAHNDISKYLVLDTFDDVILCEYGVFDFMGWDVKKALNLHFKSNANLYDWLSSPLVYVPDEIGIFEGLPQFNRETLRHQYYGQAYKTNKKYILGNDLRDKKIVKKTLYVIRCNLAWMELTGEDAPQMPKEVCDAVSRLRLAYNDLTFEQISDEDLELVHNWIGESLDGFSKTKFKAPKRNIEDYNNRFQEIIGLK